MHLHYTDSNEGVQQRDLSWRSYINRALSLSSMLFMEARVCTQVVPPFGKGRLGGILYKNHFQILSSIRKNVLYKSSLTLLFQRRGLVCIP